MARKKARSKVSVCPVCGWKPMWSTKSRRMERHHMLPVAAGGGKLGRPNIIKICSHCHVTAHQLWGPGDKYRGPTTRDAFIAALKDHLRLKGSYRKAV